MDPLVPLFVPGVPGVSELLVLLFTTILFALLVAGIVVVIRAFTRGRGGDPDAIALEQRVATLEQRVDQIEGDDRD